MLIRLGTSNFFLLCNLVSVGLIEMTDFPIWYNGRKIILQFQKLQLWSTQRKPIVINLLLVVQNIDRLV